LFSINFKGSIISFPFSIMSRICYYFACWKPSIVVNNKNKYNGNSNAEFPSEAEDVLQRKTGKETRQSLELDMNAAKKNQGGGVETKLDGYESDELGAKLLDRLEADFQNEEEVGLASSTILESFVLHEKLIEQDSRKAAGYFHNVPDDVMTKICGDFLMVEEFVQLTSTSKAFDKLRWSDKAWKMFDGEKRFVLRKPYGLIHLTLINKNISNVNLLAKWVKNTHYIEVLVIMMDIDRD
jgi:hypothetical protein